MAELRTGVESWLGRTLPKLKKIKDLADYPDHHCAAFRCMLCDTIWTALYPVGANVNTMQCRECGAKDSEMLEYFKRIWKH